MIDRDDVSGAMDVFPRIRSSRSKTSDPSFSWCERHNQHRQSPQPGANFVLAKQFSIRCLRGFLDIAVGRWNASIEGSTVLTPFLIL